jgi:hypothetical protein
MKDEVGRACSTNGEKRNAWEMKKERDHWEDKDVGEWTILKYILDKMG